MGKRAGGPPPSRPPQDSQQRVTDYNTTLSNSGHREGQYAQPDLRPVFVAGNMDCCEDCSEAITHYPQWGYAGQDPPYTACPRDERTCPRWECYGEGLRVAQAIAEAVAGKAGEERRERLAQSLYDTLTDHYDNLSFPAFIHAADPALARGL